MLAASVTHSPALSPSCAHQEKEFGGLALPTDLNGNSGFIVVRSALTPEQTENTFPGFAAILTVKVHHLDTHGGLVSHAP